MVLGIFPRPELLAKYNLMDKYHALCTAIKQGNLAGYQYHLERHLPTLLREGNYIMLKERVKVVIWRTLFRKVWALSLDVLQSRADRNMLTDHHLFVISSFMFLHVPGTIPTLPFAQCLIALRFSSRDQSYDMLDIECLMVSLLDQVILRTGFYWCRAV